MSDADELAAGSDPNDAGSWLRIVAQETEAGRTATTLEFTSTPARVYQILTSPDLVVWTPDLLQFGLFPGDEDTTTITFAHDAEERLFFAVTARRPLAP